MENSKGDVTAPIQQPVQQEAAPTASSDAAEVATTAERTASTVSSGEPEMSKNQLKKMRKRQRMLDKRKEKRMQEKAAKKAKAEAEGRDLQAEHEFFVQRTAAGDRKRRLQAMWDSDKLPIAQANFRICLDCSFQDQMTEKEIASLASQLRYCYSYNKRSPNPVLWAATSLAGSTLQQLQKETGYNEWVNRAYTGTPQSLEEYYKSELQNVVYLTSDSDNTITDLDNSKIYVIGGIVDRNRLKLATLHRAQKLGIATAKLPLAEQLAKMPATRVLTCNHVFDILLKYREHGNDWSRALQQVLPSRKEAEFRDTKTASKISGSSTKRTSEEETTKQDDTEMVAAEAKGDRSNEEKRGHDA